VTRRAKTPSPEHSFFHRLMAWGSEEVRFFSISPFIGSWLTVLVLMGLQLCLFTPNFFSNDDVFGILISKGVGLALQPDEHLFFQNVLLGLALQKLYTIFPAVNWYAGCEVLALFLSLWTLLAGLFLRVPNRFTLLLFLLYFLFIGLYYGTQLDYTMLSCLACQGGLFLLMAAKESPNIRRWGSAVWLGGLCFLMSFLFRFEAFIFSLLLAAPFLLSGFLKGGMRRREWVTIAAVAGIAALGILFDYFYYQKDPGWKAYVQINPILNSCLEYQHWDYNPQTQPLFNSLGWSGNDFKLFFRDYYLDPDLYSSGKLQKISAFFGSFKVLPWASFPRLFSTSTNQALYALQNIVLCFLAFLPFCPPPRLRLVLGNALWVLLVLAFLASYAKATERLYLPAFSFLAALALTQARLPGKTGPLPGKGKAPLRMKLGFLLLGLMLALTVPLLARFFAVSAHFRERERLLSGTVEALHPRPDQLYVVWNSGFPYEKIHAFDSFEMFRDFHLAALGDFQRTPLTQGMLEHFGIKNLFRDMVDNPNLFMICSPEEGKLCRQYLKEKFGIKSRVEVIFFSPFFNVMRVQSLTRPLAAPIGTRD
jgi:hypothetical protein